MRVCRAPATCAPAAAVGPRRGGGRSSRCSAVACAAAPPPAPAGHLRVHYTRTDGAYDGWGLHAWGAVASETAWAAPLPSTPDDTGVFWDVALKGGEGTVSFMVHQGDAVDAKGSVAAEEAPAGVWVVSGCGTVFRAEPDLDALPRGDLTQSRAFWLDEDVLATPLDPNQLSFALHASSGGMLALGAQGVTGGASPPLPLRVDPAGLPPRVRARFPHLAGLTCLRLPPGAPRLLLLKCQLALAARGADGAPVDATGVQIPGALDALCAYDGPLGAARAGGDVVLRVWAPTAQAVQLLLYAGPRGGEARVLDMREGARGVWEARGPAASWLNAYYHYRVTAFHPSTCRLETCDATDPYARSLAANGTRAQVVTDLDTAELMPPGWRTLASRKPPLAHHGDAVLYELHVRDFSVSDDTVPADERGTFLAFARDSAGTRHLATLADAGVTHVHLLPVYDFGSVDERRDAWQQPAAPGGAPLDGFPPDSEVQQAAVSAVANVDAYNWGYDPVHWGVPDGSYCTMPDGAARTLQFRTAVSALNALGLRVVVDVVYNHLYASGPSSPHSVLDKLVPSYYVRRDGAGGVEASTCMNNTASEHAMCERLIVDDLLHWATAYKVDGFRFDLMGHLMKRVLLRARAALDALRPGLGGGGVDGRGLLMYGEGWDYAEVADGRLGENGSQRRLAGTGIGTFNDRLREGAMGGGPFGDPRQQGLLTGLFTAPAPGVPQGSAEEQRAALARATERVLAGVAGNLAAYEFTGAAGATIAAADAGGAGSHCGYAASPAETVNYCAAHDNETLFDLVALKLHATAPLAARCRVVGLAQALLAWSQGVPFFHAGDELLRSKSLDRDSYNSGDWFNALDWTGRRTGWGVGLPPAGKNGAHWALQRQLLADPAAAPSVAHAAAAAAHFRRVLRVRASSPLFRLRTAADVQARLRLLNRGADEAPGVLCWHLLDEGGRLPRLDARHARLLIGLNATQQRAALPLPDDLRGLAWRLHPVLAEDEMARAATVADGVLALPPLTAAVFVVLRG